MIEDKELGLKIAEDPVEKMWTTIKTNTEKRIFENEIQIDIDKHILEYAKDKLKPFSKS